jgi:hypothetical protein
MNLIEPIASQRSGDQTAGRGAPGRGLDAWKNGTITTQQQLIAACDFYAPTRPTLTRTARAVGAPADSPSGGSKKHFQPYGKSATGWRHAGGSMPAIVVCLNAVIARPATRQQSR